MSCGGKPTTAFKTAARRIFLTATDENDTSEKTQGGGGGLWVIWLLWLFDPLMDRIRTHTHTQISGYPCVGPLGTPKESVNLRGGSELRIWAAGWESSVTEVKIYGNTRGLVAAAQWDMSEQETDWLTLLGSAEDADWCTKLLMQKCTSEQSGYPKYWGDLRCSTLNRLCVFSFCLSSLWSYPE